MSRMLLGYGNLCDSGVLSGGACYASLPLENLQDRRPAKVARFISGNDTWVQIDLYQAQAQAIGVVALVNHNFSANATVQIRGALDPGMTRIVYDSGAVAAWPVARLDGYPATYIQQVPDVVAPYWRADIVDTGNPDGAVQIGRLFIGTGWMPVHGPLIGASLVVEDASLIETSLAGSDYFYVSPRPRVHQIQLQGLNTAEAYGRLLDLQAQHGISGEVLINPDVADTLNRQRRAFVGRIKSLAPVVQVAPQVFSTALEIKEIL